MGSGSIGNTFSETFSSTKRQTSIFDFGDGTVWQWTFVVEDQCGKSTVRTQFVGRTNGVPEKPCCLPGFSAQFDKLHGPCHGSTPLASYCGGPTSPPTPAPTPAWTPAPTPAWTPAPPPCPVLLAPGLVGTSVW